MKVASILAGKGTRVATIRPSAPLAQAVARFRAEGIGALVVTDTAEAILGLVTERDASSTASPKRARRCCSGPSRTS